ncbi:MAG: cell division protein FtsA [Nitrospirae bacterium]|nr:cell division protein FtsA [Nitrospirota bacterium]
MKDISVKNSNLVVGLDAGTTKVCVIVAEAGPAGKTDERNPCSGLKIIGVGRALSRGIKKGVITNIENTADSIREAVRAAETAAGVDIKAVYTGITGAHIGCFSSRGVIAVKEKEIGQKEVDSVIDAASAVALPFDREMLHVIPTGYTVNGQNGITDPRGMGGVRLETDVRIITGAATSIQNLIKSCQKAGLEVVDVILQPYASAGAVLTDDEKELGVAIIDIGGGTADLMLFHEGHICHAAVLPIGGNNFTNDVAVGLRVPAQEAEILKIKYGCSMLSMARDDEEIEVGHAGGKIIRKIPKSHLVEILQPRAEELFGLLKKEIMGNDFHKHMNSGVVLTGGAVLMKGMDVMAENMLELPVRIGAFGGAEGPADIINNPVYSAGVGLALYGAEKESADQRDTGGNMFTRVKGWVGGMLKIRS